VTKVLILSGTEDAHAASVAKALAELNIEFDYYDFSQFIGASRFERCIGYSQGYSLIKDRAGRELDLRSYKGIWHRRPGLLTKEGLPEDWMNRLVEDEGRAALDSMFTSLPALWVNHPRKDYVCMKKLWQLEIAENIGFAIPKTLVTSSSEATKIFFELCGGEVIYKLIAQTSSRNMPRGELAPGLCTLPVRERDLQHIKQVDGFPHLFQEKIRKRCDLRVTIVGQRIFSIEIDSQNGRGQLDWRNDYTVKMVPFELPSEIQEKCMQMMRRLQLNYGAFDFILDPDGKCVFIEVNSAGQYLWIEQRCGMPISMELAKLLGGQTDPVVRTVQL
jgi:hypothetical protein